MPKIASVFIIISASWICKHNMTGGINSSCVLRLDETYNLIVECSKMNAFLVNWLKNRWPNTYNSQTFNNIIESFYISNVFQVFPFHVFSPLLVCFLFLFFSIPVHFGRAVRGRSSPVISCSAGGHPVGTKWPGPVYGDETRYLHNLRPVFFFFFFF